MIFSELQTAVKRRVRDSSGHMPALIKDALNWALLDLSGRYNWYWWRREGYYATRASYTTGTISVTADSMTVTGVGTVWTYQLVGSKLEVGATTVSGSATDFYRIRKVVSSTSLILETPYRGSTASAQSYIVYRDEYPLRWDVDRVNLMRIPSSPVRVIRFYQDELYQWVSNPRQTGTPFIYRPLGTTERPYYDTGTVTISATNVARVTLAGTGASADATFIGKVFRLVNESHVYEIASVPSKTKFKLVDNYVNPKVSTGTSFEIDPPGTPRIQLYPIPTTKIYVVYEYQALPKQLYANNDKTEIPDKWQEVLVLGASYRCLEQIEKDAELIQNAKGDYEGYILQKMMPKNQQDEDRVRQMQSSENRRVRWFGPRFPSNYPQPYGSY